MVFMSCQHGSSKMITTGSYVWLINIHVLALKMTKHIEHLQGEKKSWICEVNSHLFFTQMTKGCHPPCSAMTPSAPGETQSRNRPSMSRSMNPSMNPSTSPSMINGKIHSPLKASEREMWSVCLPSTWSLHSYRHFRSRPPLHLI